MRIPAEGPISFSQSPRKSPDSFVLVVCGHFLQNLARLTYGCLDIGPRGRCRQVKGWVPRLSEIMICRFQKLVSRFKTFLVNVLMVAVVLLVETPEFKAAGALTFLGQ